MADVLVKNGLLVTMDGTRRIIQSGAVATEGTRVVDVGRTEEVEKRQKAERVMDASGCIIMPGLVCSHTHLYGALLRAAPLGIEPPSDFAQILQRVWWPMDEAMTLNDAYVSALSSSLELLKTGTTCFADTFSGPNCVHLSLDHIAKAVEEVGIRGVLAFEATERHESEEGQRGLDENERFIKKLKQQGEEKIMGMVSLHASFTVSSALVERGKELSERHGVPITIHTSEGLVDLYHNLERYGKRTVERLYETGLLGPRAVLAHCVQLNMDEVELLARTGAKVAHNPMSNMLNAVGVAPVPEMMARGVKVGLGNDGYILDGFENIRAAFLLHKVHRKDPRVMDPQVVVEMATIRGAELYGLDGELGSIEVGKRADLIVVRPDVLPTPLTPETVMGHLVNTVDGDDVRTVMVNGEVLMEDREVLTVDEEQVQRKSQEAAEALWDRLKEMRPMVEYLR